ncbi:MAG: hypothetical protein V1750_02310, partial [Acidobacteriota bacterium]
EALLAFHEGRYPRALELTQQAFERVPWLYEARVLEADIHVASSAGATRGGRLDESRAALSAAAEALQAAARIGESDRVVRERLCGLWTTALHIEVWQEARRNAETYDRATAACRDVLIVDPDSVAGRVGLLEAASCWAEYALTHGEDPTATLDAGIAAARVALDLQPDNAQAHALVGLALWQLGKHHYQTRRDPRAAFDEATRHVERSLELQPRSVEALSTLGLLHLDRGAWEAYSGVDAVPSFEKAAATFTALSELQPADPAPRVNLGIAHVAMLEHLVRTGRGDPEAVAAKAIAAFKSSLEINSNLYWTYAFLGAVHVAMARLSEKRDTDPTSTLDAALTSLNRAIELGPSDPRAYRSLCEVHAMRASWELFLGRRPDGALRAGRQALARLRTLTGQDTMAQYHAEVFDYLENEARKLRRKDMLEGKGVGGGTSQ